MVKRRQLGTTLLDTRGIGASMLSRVHLIGSRIHARCISQLCGRTVDQATGVVVVNDPSQIEAALRFNVDGRS